jgi:hypothetical protein
LLGWRLWQVRDDVGRPMLVSPVQGVPWPRGVMTATCFTCRRVTSASCRCGLYAFASVFEALAEWSDRYRLVLGEVRGWGHTAIHEYGFRCEHAQILRLHAPTLEPELRAALADAYDCPVS